MRKWKQANLCLAVSVGVFIVAVIAHVHGASAFWYYTAQAALIGSVADWFAVSALFTKPLGIPWHTNLVLRYRNSLVSGMGRITAERLVRPEWWEDVARVCDPVLWAQRQWQDPTKRAWILAYTQSYVERWLANLPGQMDMTHVADYLRKRMEKEEIYRLCEQEDIRHQGIQRMTIWGANELRTHLDKDETKKWIEEEIAALVRTKTNGFWGGLGRLVGEVSGVLDYAEMTESVRESLYLMTAQLADSDTDLHRAWVAMVDAEWMARWDDPKTRQTLQEWQAEWLRNLPLETALTQMGTELWHEWSKPTGSGTRLGATVVAIIERAVDAFFAHPQWSDVWSEKIRRRMLSFMQAEHHRIGRVAESVIAAYSGAQLNQFVRSKVEDELAKIRINGAIVGAIIGAVVWLLLVHVYEPFLVWWGIR